MRYMSRYRRPYYHNQWDDNPDSPESDIRRLLQKMTRVGWRAGQNPPSEWHIPFLGSHPEWSPLWLVATAFHTTPDELLSKIRPGKRKTRNIDELNVFYDFIKERLVETGDIRGKDVNALASELGLSSLSGTGTAAATERSYILRQLVRDGYANQVTGRFRGSSHYLPTQKLLDEYVGKLRPTAPSPPPSLPIIIPITPYDSPVIEDIPPLEPLDILDILPESIRKRPEFVPSPIIPTFATDDTLFRCESSANLPFDKIAFATRADGSRPAQQAWEKLSAKAQKYFTNLFIRICQHGKIADGKKFKKLTDSIWEFKSITHKLRITCFMYQRAIYLCNIFTKKEDVMPTPREVNLAEKIRVEHINKRRNPARRLRRHWIPRDPYWY